jgi:hypothetical protein
VRAFLALVDGHGTVPVPRGATRHPRRDMRNVKGVLFADYVRMIRSYKLADWTKFLETEDLEFLKTRIEPAAWYPMEVFERLGNAILHVIAHDRMEAVRLWGRLSVDPLHAANPGLLAPGDPLETLTRFRILRSTFFDFEALTIPMLHDGEAHVSISYEMGLPAEEAASYQTMGFFERLLELSGATSVKALFIQRSWTGDPKTLIELRWEMPRASAR